MPGHLPIDAEALGEIPSYVHPELRHLPFDPEIALKSMTLNRIINQKITEGYFSDKLIFIAAMPKSGSSFIADCLRRLQGDLAGPGRKYASYMLHNEDSDYRLEMVAEFPLGGVLKYHTRASGKNLRIMHILRCKQMILLRSILDAIVATACHYREEKIPNQNMGIVYDHIRPLNPEFLGLNVNVHDTIDYLITGGYLTALLFWISDWLELRDQSVSIVCTYEDFMEDSLGFFENACDFFGFDSLTRKERVDLGRAIDKETDELKSSKKDIQKYPYGWTGETGIWLKYFSRKNYDAYNTFMKEFHRSFKKQYELVSEFC